MYCTAFACDLIFTAGSVPGLKGPLNCLVGFLARVMMENAYKFSLLVILLSGWEHKSEICDVIVVKLHGEEIRPTTLSSKWRYVGATFSAIKRVQGSSRLEQSVLLEKLSRAHLKPQYRLVVFHFYILPLLKYLLTWRPISAKTLLAFYRSIRTAVRR